MKVGEEGRRAKIEVEKLYNIPSADVLNLLFSDATECTALALAHNLELFELKNFPIWLLFRSLHHTPSTSYRIALRESQQKLIKICWLLCALAAVELPLTRFPISFATESALQLQQIAPESNTRSVNKWKRSHLGEGRNKLEN